MSTYQDNPRDLFSPEAILRLSARNTTLHACLTYWRRGELRWEEALAMTVVHLAAQNDKLLETAVAKMSRDIQPIIIKGENLPDGHAKKCSHCGDHLKPDAEIIPTFEHTSAGDRLVTLCRSCYNKAGNSVR